MATVLGMGHAQTDLKEGAMAASLVCAVDDSPSADEVVRVAVRMKERLDLRLVIAHAVPVRAKIGLTSSSYLYSSRSDLDQEANKAREALLRLVGRACGASGADLRVLIGDPVETVLLLAEEEEAQLIVVGSRGRGALKAALLGSVSAMLTKRASCPVTVVPPHARAEA
jgi:nucleotide-binding universal stress UspA family protein